MAEISQDEDAKPFETDLLGDPVEWARAHWGRPGFKKTVENQGVVTALAAAGWKPSRIARQLEIDEKTLRKHFSRELAEAADTADAMALVMIFQRALDGNVSACREVRNLAAAGRAAPRGTVPDGPKAAASMEGAAAAAGGAGSEGRPEPKGKKERFKDAAARPSASWGAAIAGRRN